MRVIMHSRSRPHDSRALARRLQHGALDVTEATMEQHDDQRERESRGGIGGGSFGGETRGMGDRLEEIDLEAAEEHGSDPPGGLGTDIGGGSGEIGTDDLHGRDKGRA
jgi:hypothetical protein